MPAWPYLLGLAVVALLTFAACCRAEAWGIGRYPLLLGFAASGLMYAVGALVLKAIVNAVVA